MLEKEDRSEKDTGEERREGSKLIGPWHTFLAH